MIPDHDELTRAAPETFDRDWFLAQLNGRDPAAARLSVAPAASAPVAALTVVAATPTATVPEPRVAVVEPAVPVVEPAVARDAAPEPEPQFDPEPEPAPGPDSEADLEPVESDPVAVRGLGARRGAVLVGAVVGLTLVASAAFALSVTPRTEGAGAENRPAADKSNSSSATPNPQLTTLPFPGDAAKPGAPGADGSAQQDDRGQDNGQDAAGQPAVPGQPAAPSQPTSPSPSSSAPTDPTSEPPSPDPTTPDPSPTDTDPTDPTPPCDPLLECLPTP